MMYTYELDYKYNRIASTVDTETFMKPLTALIAISSPEQS